MRASRRRSTSRSRTPLHGERRHHLVAEPGLIVKHVVRNAEPVGDAAGVIDILTGTTGTGSTDRRAMVVKLKCDANDIVSLALQQSCDDRGIDATRHGHDNARVGGCTRQHQAVETALIFMARIGRTGCGRRKLHNPSRSATRYM